MKFRGYQNARPGIMSMLQAVNAPGGNSQRAGVADFAQLASAMDKSRESQASAAITEDQLAARQSLPAAYGGMTLPDGVNADSLSTLTRLNENPSIKDILSGLGTAQGTATSRRAVDAAMGGNPELANRLNTLAKPGESYRPYTANEAGILNTGTGALAPNDVSRSVVGKNEASAASSYAQGRQYDAGARENDAQARKAGFMTVTPGASVMSVADMMRAQTGGAQPQPPQPPVDPAVMQGVPGAAGAGKVGGSVLDALSNITTPDEERAMRAPQGAQPLATAPGKASADKPPKGYMEDPNNPGRLQAIPGGPGDKGLKPLTEGQSKAVMFATRADAMDKQLNASKYNPSGNDGAWDRLTAGPMLTNWMASKEGQTFINQGKNFVAAVLRKESGATITEPEWESGQQLYIPLPGDSEKVKEQKKYNRALAIEGIKAEAGDAIDRVKVPMPPAEDEATPTTSGGATVSNW